MMRVPRRSLIWIVTNTQSPPPNDQGVPIFSYFKKRMYLCSLLNGHPIILIPIKRHAFIVAVFPSKWVRMKHVIRRHPLKVWLADHCDWTTQLPFGGIWKVFAFKLFILKGPLLILSALTELLHLGESLVPSGPDKNVAQTQGNK